MLLSLSGPEGSAEHDGRSEVRRANLTRTVGWKCGGSAAYPAQSGWGTSSMSGSQWEVPSGIFLRGSMECGSAPVETGLA